VRIDVASLRSAIGQALLLESLEVAFAGAIAPALVEIGELWQAHELTVAQEHLASGAIRASLLRLLADQRANVRGSAVLACAPGEWHEIGLLMLAILLRADGWQVAYLGPNTPVDDALSLARGLGASAVMFSATRDEPLATLRSKLDDAHLPEGIDVVVGGSATDHRAAGEAVAALR
jgi:methanogenic corrinoid protein MtbC1